LAAASTAARSSASVNVDASIGLRRRDAAAGRQLDLRRALHELLAHAHRHFIRTVRDHRCTDLLAARHRRADRARHFERLTEVTVAAGDGDHRARGEDARTGQVACVDGALESERRTAHVPDGRESAHEGCGRLGGPPSTFR
jgi:hypothetical protein